MFLVIHEKLLIAFGDESFKFLTCQLSTVGYWPTLAVTGNRESGFDSGEEFEKRQGRRNAQIAQSSHKEAVIRNSSAEHPCLVIGMKCFKHLSATINWCLQDGISKLLL